MKFAVPEISWHNRDPVLSVDFQPKVAAGEPSRLATGGTDSHVLIWYISTTATGSVNLEVAADLTRHQKAVNVVRWSPSGEFLASGDDESIIFIWKQKNEEPTSNIENGEEVYKESWVIHKTLRGHMEDVLDISWSPNSLHLASGSVDNKLIVWDVNRGKYSTILTDHKGFVQGVAWDPKSQMIASTSSDRVFRTFDVSSKKVTSRSSKAILPFPSSHPLHNRQLRLYHDDTLQTYFRRLQFSPDGLLIAVPAGRIEPEQANPDMKPINAVYIYTRYSLKVPAAVLPCGDAALVTRWSPVVYAPRSGGPSPPAFASPRRMILAVATKRSVLVYDTQQKTPVAMISNIHYTRLTDLSWSHDGLTLVASSTDGFCSVIMFNENELGQVLPDQAPEETNQTEPMEIQKETTPEPKEKGEPSEPKKATPKIESYMKFKTPTEKSPKKRAKTDKNQQKTPVKLDVLVETAMQSWSDNSQGEIVKTTEQKPIEIMEIEDSEDMKLVYEDTEMEKDESETKVDKKSPEAKNTGKKSSETKNVDKKTPETKNLGTKSAETKNLGKKSSETKNPDKKSVETKNQGKPSEPKTLDSEKKSPERKVISNMEVKTPTSSNFLKQAKVTDVKQPAGPAVPSPKAPRRVSFVTLSSPKNKKKC